MKRNVGRGDSILGFERLRWTLAAGHCALLICAGIGVGSSDLCAQAPPKNPEPDVIVFTNGDKLTGHFERSSGTTVTFQSEVAGEVNLTWSKIRELRTHEQFAVIMKDGRLTRREAIRSVQQGVMSMTGRNLKVEPRASATPVTIPVSDVREVVGETQFQKALHEPGPFQDWTGNLTAGITLIQATQRSRTYTQAVSLTRAIPVASWLERRYRTTIDFSSSYGTLSQPGSPTLKTNIYHADAEQDEYFKPDLFAFCGATFDHNFSQGLDLQQNYSGGVGWTALHSTSNQLDLRGSAGYEKQQFLFGAAQTLIVSTLAESFSHKFNPSGKNGPMLTQQFSVTGPWNNLNADTATTGATFGLPLYKRIGLSTSLLDTFLNDPPPGFKKNSLQVTTGLTYSLH